MPGAEFWILGSGTEEKRLADLARERGVSDQVKLLGRVPASDMPGWLARCDAGILPMRQDIFLDFAFPNKLPEFIIMGKPVLMSGLKTIRYYFSERALAYFTPNDAAALARQMERLYHDLGLRTQLAARAKQEYVPLRWDIMKRRYLNVIEQASGVGRRTESPATSETMAAGR